MIQERYQRGPPDINWCDVPQQASNILQLLRKAKCVCMTCKMNAVYNAFLTIVLVCLKKQCLLYSTRQ